MAEDEHVIQAHYALDDDDRAALGDLLPEGVELTYRRTIYPDGDPRYSMTPWQPRDLSARREARQLLEASLPEEWLRQLDNRG